MQVECCDNSGMQVESCDSSEMQVESWNASLFLSIVKLQNPVQPNTGFEIGWFELLSPSLYICCGCNSTPSPFNCRCLRRCPSLFNACEKVDVTDLFNVKKFVLWLANATSGALMVYGSNYVRWYLLLM